MRSSLQRFFKLALEEVLELQDVRAGREPATQHDPVDFTRPETYEIWLKKDDLAADDLEDAKMQYPAEPGRQDAEHCSVPDLLQWLRAAAATPHSVCQVGCRLLAGTVQAGVEVAGGQ